jgi:hypothetical protein
MPTAALRALRTRRPPTTPLASLVLAWRARQPGPSAPSYAGRQGPLTLARNRAQTLGALANAAAESPPAARRRAELASAKKLAAAYSGGSLESCTAMD